MPAGAKAKPISDGDSSSGITDLRRKRPAGAAARERSENM